jgi:hypothetical protein
MQPSDRRAEDRADDIQQKLRDLGELLSELSSQMKRVAACHRRGLEHLEEAEDPEILLAPDGDLGTDADFERRPAPVFRNGRFRMNFAQYVEFASAAEVEKFGALAPITPDEIAAVDWDELAGRLRDCA